MMYSSLDGEVRRTNSILVAEDELEVRNYLGVALRSRGYSVEFAQDGDEALRHIQAESCQVKLVLMDILMPGRDGLETLREIRRVRPELPVIMLSGAVTPGNVVSAMKSGAVDFLPKPMKHEDLLRAIEKVLPLAREEEPAVDLADGVQFPEPASAWSQKVELLIHRIGASSVHVLLHGETGVGKEVIARRLHAHSSRAKGPFLKLNCAALPSELVESELFGYEKGAFTGAYKNTPGKFEMAEGGTILLDEIGDMDVRLQAKLLQVLQDHKFIRLGSKETSTVNVRVMAATHRNLEQAIKEGKFREDLYYRLNVVDIRIPPLRDRRDEILPLAEHFLRIHSTPQERTLPIPPSLREAMLMYRWPGNVRELENLMRRYLVLRQAEALADDLRRRERDRPTDHGHSSPEPAFPEISEEALPEPLPQAPSAAASAPEPEALKAVAQANRAAEIEAIVSALNVSFWNRKRAAALLGIDYKALLYKMKKLDIGSN